jgi:hypothetical protein
VKKKVARKKMVKKKTAKKKSARKKVDKRKGIQEKVENDKNWVVGNEAIKIEPVNVTDAYGIQGIEGESKFGDGWKDEGWPGKDGSSEYGETDGEDKDWLEQAIVKLEERYKLKFSIETKNIIKAAVRLAVNEGIDAWKIHTREVLVAIAYYGQKKERKYNTAQFVLEKLRSKRSDYLEDNFKRIDRETSIDKIIERKVLKRTGYAADAFRWAKKCAFSTTDKNLIRIRHLLAALLLFRAAGKATISAQSLIEEAGIELPTFIREFQQYVTNTFKDDDTEEWERIFSEKVADEEKSVQIDTLEKIDKKVADEGAEGEEVEEAVGASIEGSSVPDQPTKIDTLGFEPYTTAIANFLSHENTKPPLTISVEGEWGSGKTSFMMQLGNKLRVKEGLIIEFSPWMHEDQESLWAAFALEFTRQLSESLSWWESIIARVKLLWQRFNWREGWVEVTKAGAVWLVYVLALLGIILIVWGEGLPYIQSVVLKAFLSVAVVAGVIGRALKKLGDCIGSPLKFDLKKYVEMPDYTDRVCFIERFHEDFKKIIDVYAMKKNVYVFIDDLDRCKVPIAAEIMQAINMMISDNPRVTFIMGMDRRKVAASLAVKDKEIIHYLRAELIDKKNEESGSSYWLAGLDYGYSFIEKFIQLPFSIPRPTKSDIDNMIDHIVAKESKEIERKLISIPRSDEDLYGSSDERPSDLKDKREDIDRTPESREEEEVKEEEKRWLELKLADDSEQIRAIVHMIAPFVDYNPRRIKQFINLFRLRAYIAYETQRLILPEETEYSEGLTLEQLGKIVVISLRWPLFLESLARDEFILRELAVFSEEKTEDINSLGNEVGRRWAREDQLMQLIRFGCLDEKGGRGSEWSKYTLSQAKVDKILQVSPKIRNMEKAPLKVKVSDTIGSSDGVGVEVIDKESEDEEKVESEGQKAAVTRKKKKVKKKAKKKATKKKPKKKMKK